MTEKNLLIKLTNQIKETNSIMEELSLALDMLIRIKKIYPYVFDECITSEEVDKLIRRRNG